ncbi:MAG: acyl carrier protein [Geobacteraceae bacterium]|nr:acyl carrier protein [Geobacteraceae bacterium]
MTTMEKVCELIMKARKNKVSTDQLKPDALLVEDLGFDSLDMTELLVLAEDAFSLEIPVTDALKQRTIGEVSDYIEGRLTA